jgi:hypothetical protein
MTTPEVIGTHVGLFVAHTIPLDAMERKSALLNSPNCVGFAPLAEYATFWTCDAPAPMKLDPSVFATVSKSVPADEIVIPADNPKGSEEDKARGARAEAPTHRALQRRSRWSALPP